MYCILYPFDPTYWANRTVGRPDLLGWVGDGSAGWHGKIQPVQRPDRLAQFWRYYRKIVVCRPTKGGGQGYWAGSILLLFIQRQYAPYLMQPCLFYFCKHRNIAICYMDQIIRIASKAWSISIELYWVQTYSKLTVHSLHITVLQHHNFMPKYVAHQFTTNCKKYIKMCNNALQNARHFVTYMYF